MEKETNVLHHLLNKYENNLDLDIVTVTGIMYLIDWESSLRYGKQITNIDWLFNEYFLFSSTLYELINNSEHFKNVTIFSPFGKEKKIIKNTCEQSNNNFNLSKEDILIIEDVLSLVNYFNWNDFRNFVVNTYPVRSQKRYDILDLPKLAIEYFKS